MVNGKLSKMIYTLYGSEDLILKSFPDYSRLIALKTGMKDHEFAAEWFLSKIASPIRSPIFSWYFATWSIFLFANMLLGIFYHGFNGLSVCPSDAEQTLTLKIGIIGIAASILKKWHLWIYVFYHWIDNWHCFNQTCQHKIIWAFLILPKIMDFVVVFQKFSIDFTFLFVDFKFLLIKAQ